MKGKANLNGLRAQTSAELYRSPNRLMTRQCVGTRQENKKAQRLFAVNEAGLQIFLCAIKYALHSMLVRIWGCIYGGGADNACSAYRIMALVMQLSRSFS